MAMKDHETADPKLKLGSQPDAAETVVPAVERRLREQVATLQAANAAQAEQLAEAQAVNAEMAAIMPMQPLDEPPEYELTEPFFSQDCVLYPAGAVFRDTYGVHVPNENWIPLNPDAERRHSAYVASLPGGGTPSLDLIIESAMEIRPREGDSPEAVAAYHGRVLERALLKKFAAEGRIPPGPGEMQRPLQRRRPVRPDPNIPIMSNVRIKSLNHGDAPLSPQFQATNLPRRQVLTEQVRR